ncbi:MAG: helix-turn-helix domain-containing protein, partial [Actinomycetales bacterium]
MQSLGRFLAPTVVRATFRRYIPSTNCAQSLERDMPLGAYLAVAREEAGLSQAELADRVRLRTTVLMAIEDDDYSMCGGDV